MRGSAVWLALALALALVPVASRAQPAPRASGFPRDPALLRDALCGGRRACSVESVLDAGHDRGSPLAVVHLAIGRRRADDEGCHGYSDRLVVFRRGRVRQLRELSRGTMHCLEWQPSVWSFENGELVFTYTGMGAPPPSGTDMRPTRSHFRPWPLSITAQVRGTEAVLPLPALPARGPVFVLSME